MYEVFFRKFNEKVSLTAEDEDRIRQYLTPKKLRKKQCLLQEGDICKHLCTVVQFPILSYANLFIVNRN